MLTPGRFQCTKCPSHGSAVAEYVFMLLCELALNGYLIAQLSQATMTDFTTVQGSDYLQVGMDYVLHLQAVHCIDCSNNHHLVSRCILAVMCLPSAVTRPA